MAKPKKPIWLLLDSKKPLLFRKQVLHVGDFKKLDASGDGVEFSITPEILNHLAQSVAELQAAGVAIPFANGHDAWEDAANRLGDVVGAAVEDGKLFLDVQFSDTASRDLAIKSDVSVGLLDKFYDGRGRLHRTVLRHLAATSAPVIPALDEWHQIAAAFNHKNTSMTSILELLGVETEELALSAIQELQAKAADTTEKIDLSHSPLVVRTIRDAREAVLAGLVSQGAFTPAAKAELVTEFCTDKTISLELSRSEAGQAFDFAIKLAKVCSKSRPVTQHGRSAAPISGEVELAHSGQGSTYPQRVAAWAEVNKDRFSGRNGSK